MREAKGVGCKLETFWWFSEVLWVTKHLFEAFLITLEALAAALSPSSAVFVNVWWFDEFCKSRSMTLPERFSEGDRIYPLEEPASPDPLLTIFNNLFFLTGTSLTCYKPCWSLGEITFMALLLINFIWELLFIMTLFSLSLYCLCKINL